MSIAHQRCWNHAAREASCRCPACKHFFCRECVTEHDTRLLCASCVSAISRGHRGARSHFSGFLGPVAGLLLAAAVFYTTARVITQSGSYKDEQRWRTP